MLDLTLVLDASGSIEEEDFQRMQLFGSGLLDYITLGPEDTQVALVTYSSTASVAFTFNTTFETTEEFANAIGESEHEGQKTNIAEALHMAGEQIYGVS